jgi:RNA polymerase sigma factor (TIGR02999 family)
MTDVTRILSAIEEGDAQAAEKLLPLVYEELRKLAAAKMAQENPGQTLQATALVHEAYLRLVDVDKAQHWDSRGHFFSAAAEAMRRILVENARHKKGRTRGGDLHRVDLDSGIAATETQSAEILEVDEALTRLSADDPVASELVKLRFFAGFSLAEAAEIVGLPRSSAYEQWAYARARIRCLIGHDE